MCSRERGLRSRNRAVANWLALHLHRLQSIDQYRCKTQWNWSDDRSVDPALATGCCWSCSLCQRFLCIFIKITNPGRPESRISWLPHPGRVIPRLARASLHVTASRKVQRTGLRVHPFFPKRRESSAPADTTRPYKSTFITDEQTSLLKAYVFSCLDKFGTREALNFCSIARVAISNSRQQRATAGTWNERTWAKLRTKGFQ